MGKLTAGSKLREGSCAVCVYRSPRYLTDPAEVIVVDKKDETRIKMVQDLKYWGHQQSNQI